MDIHFRVKMNDVLDTPEKYRCMDCATWWTFDDDLTKLFQFGKLCPKCDNSLIMYIVFQASDTFIRVWNGNYEVKARI